MFKSIQESIKSLLSTSTNDKKDKSGTKRKRTFYADTDEEDPDIQIVKVEKRRRLETQNPFWSILHWPSKMGEWMRFKSRPFSEQFATVAKDNRQRPGSHDNIPKRNGAPSRVMKGMIHGNKTKGHENQVQQRSTYVMGADHGMSMQHDIPSNMNGTQYNGERRSSTSSSCRPSPGTSSAMECIRLKEREEYQKLLKMQSKLSSSPSRMSLFLKDSDVLSVSSGSSGNASLVGLSTSLSQTRQRSNSSIFNTPHYRQAPNKTFTTSSDISLKQRPVEHTKLSLESLIARQKRLAAQDPHPPSSNTTRSTDTNRKAAAESRAFLQSKEPVVILDDEEDAAVVGKRNDLFNDKNDNSFSKPRQHQSLDFRDSVYLRESYIEKLKNSRLMQNDQWRRQVEEEEMKAKAYEEKRRAQNIELEKRLKHQMRIFEEEPEVSEEILLEEEEEEEEEEVLPELTESMLEVIRSTLRPGPPGEVLADGFRLQITRRDMATLAGLNWLNDEIINFYMNMLIERGEQDGMAKVYAFNTFFYPKIMSGGHSTVKRWTKKVDIFAMHYILIPVHLGMHWCLCVADMKNKEITYYDSMGGKNKDCLTAVLKYINDESVAKRQKPINSPEWKLEIAQDNPQQLNGSDCGMFSCKYAEYITRGKKITFTQEDMPYFRQRMVYEIKTKKLLQ